MNKEEIIRQLTKLAIYQEEFSDASKAIGAAIEYLKEDKNNTMKMIELWNDSDTNALVDRVYMQCKDKDCDICPYSNEVEDDICKADIIMELWRKWQNYKLNIGEDNECI